jgi:hypothetical protein
LGRTALTSLAQQKDATTDNTRRASTDSPSGSPAIRKRDEPNFPETCLEVTGLFGKDQPYTGKTVRTLDKPAG